MKSGTELQWREDGVPLNVVREAAGGHGTASHAPVRIGVPWAQGQLLHSDQLVLNDSAGDQVPAQCRILETWPDGTPRWLLVDWVAAFPAGDESVAYRLRAPNAAPNAAGVRPVLADAQEGTDAVRVDTGRAVFDVSLGADGGLKFRTTVGGEIRADGLELAVLPAPLAAIFTSIQLVENGTVRAAVEVTGTAGQLEIILALDFFTGSALVRAVVGVRNPAPAQHDNGRWPLGAASSVLLDDLSLTAVAPDTGEVSVQAQSDAPWQRGEDALVYQDSSGGENWNCHNHVNRSGVNPCRFRGYSSTVDAVEGAGERASPIVLGKVAGGYAGAFVPSFWQNFPKAMAARSGVGLRVGIFPDEFADVHEIQGGEQKHHEVWFDFDADVDATALSLVRARPVAVVGPEWIAQAHGVHYLTEAGHGSTPDYEEMVRTALDPTVGFAAKRELIDEYGWRNFGDLYADHEAHFHTGEAPFISHYNNQYDGVYGCGLQFLRTGDARWFRLMCEMAEHVRDIDVYHTRGDRWGYNLGMFWHSLHYQEAGIASHRTYGPGDGNAGGGPSPEHLYPSGLALHYRLTGAAASRSAAVGLGEYVIGSDDGRLQRYAILDSGPTGYVSASGSEHYHGPGRAPGNCLVALIEAFRLSGERRYVDKAEELVRRVIHPDDDIAARELGDIENRWYYMVFLHSLLKYLELKEELGEIDQRYAYARASVLHYVRWAAEHEYPYLEKPERLEFPTETWAAQEMRKSEVFFRASRHVEGAERSAWLEKAEAFYRVSLDQIRTFPTYHYARPVSLMLVFGVIRGAFNCGDVSSAPPGPALQAAGQPISFVSQKFRFLKRLKLLVAGAGAAFVLGVGALIWVA